MSFDYSKLSGRIREKFGTQAHFSKALNMSERSLSLKMQGKRAWTQIDIINYKKDYTQLEKRMLMMYNDGEMAGRCYEDYIAHEMAHVIPFQNCTTDQEYRDLSEVLKSEFIAGISGYADRKKDGRESLAEAFVKYRNGEEIPKAAQELIKKYIEPWRR